MGERIIHNDFGEEIHVFGDDELRVKKLDPSIWLPTGQQWCPDCHIPAEHRGEGEDGYWECPQCRWSITDQEAEDGDRYPTLESTYEDDYGEYYSDDNPEWYEDMEDEDYDEDE